MQEFADLFKQDYEHAKSVGSLDGSSIKSLNDYLGSITKMGEFDHKMDQPFKSFVSQLLDITIIIPFIECATGYDLITGEDLTSFELTMKGVFAVVDFLTLGTAVLATKPFEVGGMAAVKLAGKTIVTTMASDATAYTVGYLSNQAGAPLAITMLLSMGSGIAVTKVAGKYFFRNAAGDLLGECNVPGENLDGLKGSLKSELSEADRIKIDKWKYRPDDDLYIKNKKVFDNPKYYDQATGSIIYPGMNGDINTNGFIDGISNPDVLKKGKRFTRYGDDGNAQFFSDSDVSFEQRALPPGTEKKPLVEIKVLKDIPCSSDKIKSWFDQPGGGIQYYTNEIKALDGSMVPATLENLKKNLYIKVRIIK